VVQQRRRSSAVRPLARFNDRLAAFARVICFDRRGVGLSEPVPATALPTLEEWMDDLRETDASLFHEPDALVQLIGNSWADGRRIGVHAQGDPAISLVLDELEGGGIVDRSTKLVHGLRNGGFHAEGIERMRGGGPLLKVRVRTGRRAWRGA
jgi:pimeloyl-ACP methyl ester carboxylesterase